MKQGGFAKWLIVASVAALSIAGVFYYKSGQDYMRNTSLSKVASTTNKEANLEQKIATSSASTTNNVVTKMQKAQTVSSSTKVTTTKEEKDQIWQVGTTHTITWQRYSEKFGTSTLSAMILLRASGRCTESEPPRCWGTDYMVATSTPNSGFYKWTIPQDLPKEYLGHYYLLVKSGLITYKSDIQTITIKDPPPSVSDVPYPSWFEKEVNSTKGGHPISLTRYEFNGQIVYYAVASCCDFYDILYDNAGNEICYQGGYNGETDDTKCPRFFRDRYLLKGEEVWNFKDSREYP